MAAICLGLNELNPIACQVDTDIKRLDSWVIIYLLL